MSKSRDALISRIAFIDDGQIRTDFERLVKLFAT